MNKQRSHFLVMCVFAITHIYIPIVASWSNGQHDPPKQLVPVYEEVKSMLLEKNKSIYELIQASGIDISNMGGWESFGPIRRNLKKEIKLPSGKKSSFGEVMAAIRYVDLQQMVKQRAERNARRSALATMAASKRANSEETTYEQVFFDLYKELGINYPCFEMKGIDWKAVGRELLPRAKNIKTNEEFGLLCIELVARLKDSHAQVLKGSADLPTITFPRWDPGFACLIDDHSKPVVYHIDKDSPADTAGVRIGMTVLSVDGKPAHQVIKERMNNLSKYVGFSSQRYLQFQIARSFVRQQERGQKVKLEMLDTNDKKHSFTLPATLDVRYLPRLPVPIPGISDSANVSWTMLDDNIGYIYVRRIRQDLIEKLDRAVGQLNEARGLIVDVRGNSGGGFDGQRSHRNFDPNDGNEPLRPRFIGPIAVLIDSRCISAGEGWASWFIANERARVFGEATAGASSKKRTKKKKNGLFKVKYPIRARRGYLQRPIEFRGLEPDVPIKQNARDLAADRDTVLETAKRYLLNIK